MDIIQFNAGGSTVPKLKQGELYINLIDLDKGELYVGSANQDTTATNDHFVIKSNPLISDIKNYQGTSLTDVCTGISITGTSGNVPTKFTFYKNGTNEVLYENTVKIQGTVANADHAGDAKKLVDINNADLSEGAANQPVYFKDGVPTPITVGIGGGRLAAISQGVISVYSTKIGENYRPVYYNGNSGFAVIDNIGNNTWKPTITASSITASSINGSFYIGNQYGYGYILQANSGTGLIESSGKTISDLIDMSDICTRVGSGTITNESAGTDLSSIGITSAGVYYIKGKYNNGINSNLNFIIYISSLTVQSYSTSTTPDGLYLKTNSSKKIRIEDRYSTVGSQADSVLASAIVYKLNFLSAS